MKHNIILVFALMSVSFFVQSSHATLIVQQVKTDVSSLKIPEELWQKTSVETVTLMAQPMAIPRPKLTSIAQIKVQSVHDGKWIAFRLRWADAERNEGGRLGEFSDAVAMQFPVKDNKVPPSIFMGDKGNPVHVFHWRAMYQMDEEQGMRSMVDLYPNMNPDLYPLELPDEGHIQGLTPALQEAFSPAKAVGNPQSYPKKSVDEMMAEGFGSSAVMGTSEARGRGVWKQGQWTVVIARPLVRTGGSQLTAGQGSFMGFAAWQGGSDEVGARKSVTMSWTPIQIQAP